MKTLNGCTCPFCGEGSLVRESRDVEYKYKGHTLLIPQPGTYCDACEESILEPEDLKATRVDLQAFRSRVDGLLEPKEIRRIRSKVLGLNQKDAGELFGGGHNAFSRYERGESALPRAMSMLLSLVDNHRDLKDEIIAEKTA
ncbi:TPA: YgiT-type zinc finger protein [Vibrio vulnificus]|uniref:type II toxin-antitoxin system MqsA family antitoxin n=2 Tax=Vibrio vulnificus TaxID=672 RepID=UPI000CD123F3|nr:type II toxin-antitoxin system MqsA family antitoxin [Vibrio vulnificus]MBN8094396.1 type II toxin-antitoxin system MqsA family antitoxin [Vibrio vulnificus]POB16007.1 antitoxin [Vibrio vulnificus]HAS6026175.1 YgiT-type zinc finger protein [Vibrio vulnificus]HAS6036044.1 YgiT-type zinc finger protein [Vibrio vulnificus]